MSTLRLLMEELVSRGHELAHRVNARGELLLEHQDMCILLADEFALWTEPTPSPTGGCADDDLLVFPIWLSRVVDGVLTDHAEGIEGA